MTPALCHHEWRLSQMRHSHPTFWPPAVATDWEDLRPTDRMLEAMGLGRCATNCYLETEEEERLIRAPPP